MLENPEVVEAVGQIRTVRCLADHLQTQRIAPEPEGLRQIAGADAHVNKS